MKRSTVEEIAKVRRDSFAFDRARFGDYDFNKSISPALTQIFGQSAMKKVTRATSINDAVFVMTGMLPDQQCPDNVVPRNEKHFNYLKGLRYLKNSDVFKWNLKTLFPALTKPQLKEVREELQQVGFKFRHNKVIAFSPE